MRPKKALVFWGLPLLWPSCNDYLLGNQMHPHAKISGDSAAFSTELLTSTGQEPRQYSK